MKLSYSCFKEKKLLVDHTLNAVHETVEEKILLAQYRLKKFLVEAGSEQLTETTINILISLGSSGDTK